MIVHEIILIAMLAYFNPKGTAFCCSSERAPNNQPSK